MSQRQRDEVDGVFANLGKALAAFERIDRAGGDAVRSLCRSARSRATTGDATARLSDEEIAGLKLFIGKAHCSTCHNGPRLTDGAFHNTGVPPVAGLPADQGRATAVAEVEADPFNCLGKFRDGDASACAELRFMVRDGPVLMRAYKTPSLRGAATRPPYMHAGQIASLEAVVDHYAAAPPAIEGISELHPVTLSPRSAPRWWRSWRRCPSDLAVLDRLHRHEGGGLRHVGQGGDALAEHAPVGGDVVRAHLQEIVEARRHHVALLDLRDGHGRRG